MSKQQKQILGIAVLVVILALGFAYWKYAQAPAPTSPAEVTGLPSGNSTSNTALESDMGAIDAQLEGVQSDNANVSASVNQAAQQ